MKKAVGRSHALETTITMTRIVANIGNSRMSCGHFREQTLMETWHYPVNDMERATVELVNRLNQDKGAELAVCSVVPSATKKMKRVLAECKIECLFLSSQSQNLVHGLYSTIGIDRVATAAGAIKQFGSEPVLLVFDFGTATTLTAVDKTGKFLGGFITLGLGKTFDSLHRYTAQLPDLKQALGTPLADGLGQNTESSIISGCVLGHVGLLESWVHQSRKTLGVECAVVATGGYARYLVPHTTLIDHLEPDLTLIGINLLSEESKVLGGRA